MKEKYFFVFTLFITLETATIAIAGENSCVNCHSKITTVDTSRPAHSFSEWENSIHARKGVACDACHGGNPASLEMNDAHKNISKSSDQGSAIYFNKIPDSCGSCHAKELDGFKDSDHYKELTRSGRGPNCVTCHGSMASHVMTPRELESVCTLCHRRPTQAYAGMISLKATRMAMDQLHKDLKTAKEESLDVKYQSDMLLQAEKSYQEILKVWHSFDMKKVLTQSQDLNHRVRTAFQEIELKRKSKGEK